jgi:hypothetical protein
MEKMKRKLVLVLGVMLVLGLVMTGCDDGSGNTTTPNGNNGSGNGGNSSSSSLGGTDWEAGSGEYLYFLDGSTWARNSDSEGLTIWNTMSTYSRSGNTIKFNLMTGGTSTGTISGNTILAFGRSYTKSTH